MSEESGHFYYPDGKPCFEVPNKSIGGMRKTTVSDARKLGLIPSVSTVFSILSKPQLDDWKNRQITMAAFMTQPKPMETPEIYHSRIMKEADKPRDDAADLGTRIHKAIEQYFAGEGYDNQLEIYVNAVDKWRNINGIKFEHHEVRIVDLEFGYAGTTDVVFGRGERHGILDFKTRKTKPGKPCEPYDTQPLQIAAYSNAFFKRQDLGCNLYVSTTEPGRVDSVWYETKQLEEDFKAFTHIVALYRYLKGFK